MSEKFVYMDNAATSFPKPKVVVDKMVHMLTKAGANPGRGAFPMALEAARTVHEARENLTGFFGGSEPSRLIFTNNCTEGLNIALKGCLKKGDHVLYSPLEHNAMWRPLMSMHKAGFIEAEMVPVDEKGNIDISKIEIMLKPNTKMLACVHASNVTGTILPIREIGKIAHRHGLLFLVDAAQSAGFLPINIQDMQIDLLAFPGHKGLYGPLGSGGLYVGERVNEIKPLKQGGTGSKSHDWQPNLFPDLLESGSLNVPGIAGMSAGVSWLKEQGLANISAHLQKLTQRFLQGISQIKGVVFYGPPVGELRTPVVAVNIAGLSSGEFAFLVDQQYHIGVRGGFHCAPLAHRLMGTAETGAVRFSFGSANTEDEIDYTIQAIKEIAMGVEE